ncbi:hypothetical protein, partial [Mobiluncus mulieris]|uniref:hypothetical protein n=1 Tax=Mobiluncus mulieris TaxID=2052 RepID=UPI0021E1A36D
TKAADATPTAIFLPKFIIKTPFIWVKTSHPPNHPHQHKRGNRFYLPVFLSILKVRKVRDSL